MTKAITKTIRITGSAMGPADTWLLGAFLVLFGVAVVAALPPISASVRSALADATKAGQSDNRATVRVRFQLVRAVQAQASGGADLLPVGADAAPIVVAQARLSPRTVDLAQRIDERGINARAPPQIYRA